jgi:CRP-like cAMP-binding protein
MVGEITFFDGLPRTASCVTEEPSDVAVLSRDRFHALQMEHPRLASKFLLFVLQQNVVRLRAMTQTATSVLV